MRGWWRLYRTSVGLGLRHIVRHGYLREAVVRVVVPLDPSRYLELPWAVEQVRSISPTTVLDLASPKLLAVELARRGCRVTSVDAFSSEVERWQALTRGEHGLELVVADGRSLPFADATFDCATSISVLEHVAGDDGDARALRELVRCVRPGGRLYLTLPCAEEAYDEYRSRPHYGEQERTERGYFFQRWYDAARAEKLVASIDGARVLDRDVVGLQPDLDALYTRTFPLLVPLGPFFGLLARERRGPGGHVLRLVLERVRVQESRSVSTSAGDVSSLRP